jgi:hypothetical protein
MTNRALVIISARERNVSIDLPLKPQNPRHQILSLAEVITTVPCGDDEWLLFIN